MYDFVSHVLRSYLQATGWNEYNSYLYLNAVSAALLDFPTPPGLAFSISAAPSPSFFTTYRLRTLPHLQGNIGYLFTSIEQDGAAAGTAPGSATVPDIGGSSGHIGLKRMIERFRVHEQPQRPRGKAAVWQGGKRVDKRDYLLYGSMHIPSSRVDALYTVRLSDAWQAIVSASSSPPRVPFTQQLAYLLGLSGDSPHPSHYYSASYDAGAAGGGSAGASQLKPTPTNLQMLLQRDTGAWSTEYSYSFDDALWGFRFLHNFAHRNRPPPTSLQTAESGTSSDDSLTAGRGLRGRFSAGAEFFFSSMEKSAGFSLGGRFSTLPDPPVTLAPAAESSAEGSSSTTPSSLAASFLPSQTPTVISATLNPMMGHLSMVYAARMNRDLAACSRYDFNFYSYDSEMTFGFEYWLRRGADWLHPHHALQQRQRKHEHESSPESIHDSAASSRPLVAKSPDWSLRDRTPASSANESSALAETPIVSVEASAGDAPVEPPLLTSIPNTASSAETSSRWKSSRKSTDGDDLIGLIKARVSSTADISLMWEGRLHNSLVSAGCRANLKNRIRPLSSVGLEITYFSSAADLDQRGDAAADAGRQQEATMNR